MLSDQAAEILITCCLIGHWHVTADNLLACADLVKRQYLSTYDVDYEGPGVRIEEKGRKLALRNKWIQPCEDALYEPYNRTEIGERSLQFDK